MIHEFYFKRWGWVHTNPDGTIHEIPNATIGMVFGRSDFVDKTDWDTIQHWHWLSEILSSTLVIGKLHLQFRWSTPGEWSFHILWTRHYPLKEE
jgi:hypothetical protein